MERLLTFSHGPTQLTRGKENQHACTNQLANLGKLFWFDR